MYLFFFQFGTVVCTENTSQYCREVSVNGPVIFIQDGEQREMYDGRADEKLIVNFVQLVKESAGKNQILRVFLHFRHYQFLTV